MSFGRTRIFKLLRLSIALTLGGLFVACLDIPATPDTERKIESIKVHVLQNGSVDSTLLKINPNDSATMVAVVRPDSLEEDLQFYWLGDDDNLMGSGKEYPIPLEESNNPPKALLVKDKEGNTRTISISTITNTAPTLGKGTVPMDDDTLVATNDAPILFQWTSTDSRDDELTHILQIDKESYNVGPLTKIYQSGFTPGEHKFRVIVTDSYGDSDTLSSWVQFFVKDPEKEDE